MKKVIALLALVLLCFSVSNCGGTIRAITDDYADDYVVRSITPLAGVSGEEVTFDHQICTNAGAQQWEWLWNEDLQQFDIGGAVGKKPSFEWDFGTGADPNVSYDVFPKVTLRDGLRGPYECTLTMRGGCLDDDVITTDFTLNVAPLAAMGVAPTAVAAGGNTTFSVVGVTGNVTTYAWDFGGAARIGQTNVANPQITIVDAPGPYLCSVVIGNRFEVHQIDFTLNVIGSPD